MRPVKYHSRASAIELLPVPFSPRTMRLRPLASSIVIRPGVARKAFISILVSLSAIPLGSQKDLLKTFRPVARLTQSGSTQRLTHVPGNVGKSLENDLQKLMNV
jgi:hypothetical protein